MHEKSDFHFTGVYPASQFPGATDSSHEIDSFVSPEVADTKDLVEDTLR